MSYGARRVLFRPADSLAGRCWFDSPGLGLAFTRAEETDLARRLGRVSGLAEAMARRWVGRMTSAAEGGGGARGRGSAEPWCRGAGLAVGVGRSAWEARRWRRVGSMNEADGWRRAWMALGAGKKTKTIVKIISCGAPG